ncbi:MAG: YfiR family protein, partial [Chitinophagaceae bacterium]
MKLAIHHIKHRRTWLAIVVLSLVLLTSSKACFAQAPSTTNQLKAVFLFNFSQFVSWPSNSLADNSPFVIGILGNDPFGSYIESVVEGEKVANHS